MKAQIRFTFLIIIFCFALIAKAGDPIQGLASNGFESIEWQKVKLQDTTRKRYESVISKIIVASKFIVNVKLETDNLDKIKPSKNKDVFKNTKQIKFNNNPMTTETKGDSIIFSKLGLEAPLIPDEDNYKRESIKKTITDISTTFDIFNYLKSVSIEVLLNEKLDIKTRKVVEDVILATQAITNQKVKPRVSIKYISMDENFVAEKKIEPTFLEKAIKAAPKYANAIGLILSVLIFGILVSLLFKKYFELQEKQMELMKAHSQKVENKNDNKEDEKNKKGLNGNVNGESISEEESIKAFERFRNFLKNSPIESQLLIKKWIKAEDELSKLALNALVKQLSNEELKMIFEILTFDERKDWKSKLKVDLQEEDIKMGNAFISSQIVEDIIAPPMIKDPELLKLISHLTPKQGADVAQFNVESGVILMNIMPPKFLAEMMDHLSEEVIENIIGLSASCSEEEISAKLEKFKEELPATQAIINRSPFLENIIAHIAFASPSTEKSLFKLLATVESIELVVQTAISNLPAEIIKKVPEKIIKGTLQTFSQAQRIQYFYSQEEGQQTYLLNLFAAEGSKARELIAFEFEKIQTDPSLVEEIERNKANLEKIYFQAVRKVVRNSPEFSKEIKPIVTDWIQNLLNPNSDLKTVEEVTTEDDPIPEAA